MAVHEHAHGSDSHHAKDRSKHYGSKDSGSKNHHSKDHSSKDRHFKGQGSAKGQYRAEHADRRSSQRSGRHGDQRRFSSDQRGERGQYSERSERSYNRRSSQRSDRQFTHRGEQGADARSEQSRQARQYPQSRHGASDRNSRRDTPRTQGARLGVQGKPRRNSDGTISYPSQNPYTHRRPDEPVMPKGMEWSMLTPDERERLRGLSKEHAENIGLHILAAYALVDDDPEAALQHAQWAARQASRIDVARETLGLIAYRVGEYRTAARELRTAMRMNGYADYLPFIVDCERAEGNTKKALELATSPQAQQLTGEAKAELFLVYAGMMADLQQYDRAISIVDKLAYSQGLPGAYRMRALQAKQLFLDLSSRTEEADQMQDLIASFEQQFAIVDDEDDTVIDYDLQHVDDRMLEDLGIDAQEAMDFLEQMQLSSQDRQDDEIADDAQGDHEEQAQGDYEVQDEPESQDDREVQDDHETDHDTAAQADVAESNAVPEEHTVSEEDSAE